jgi:thiol:disulfide interchange protein
VLDGAAEPSSLGFMSAVVFALVGGLILNLMPCVFPVLSLKALSLVKISEEHPEVARVHGLAYTAGVVLSFVAIAGALMTLKIAGAEIGWGFQLQNPFIVGLLAYLFLILGLNLAGVFEIRNPFGNIGGKLASNDGPMGSFFTGILATLVAAPCTAPFMAGAIGFALVQPVYVGLLVFAALGFGLALPYLALSFVPALQRVMPRPGAWMDVFKQLLAFPMFGAAVWLAWILGVQVGATGMGALLVGAVLMSFAVWVMQHTPQNKILRAVVMVLAFLSVLAALWFVPRVSVDMPSATGAYQEGAFGEAFSLERLEGALAEDGPVFVEMTAAWCITCKVNHAAAINVESTKALFAARDVDYLIGDWTNEDPVITRYLEKYGRNGVPLYVYYGDRDLQSGKRPEAQVLPQILTPGIVRDYVAAK